MLPSVSLCKDMSELELVGPSSSTTASGSDPENAINYEETTPFTSAADDKGAFWEACVTNYDDPIALVVLFVSKDNPDGLDNIKVELVKKEVLWTSPTITPSEEVAYLYVPSVLCAKVRVVKISGGALSFRAIKCYAVPKREYRVSKNILTIDKFAVAQPFPINELVNSTAYGNLITASACQELIAMDSLAEDREQEALNLTHHLAGIYSNHKFTHGQHIDTVRVVTLSVFENAKRIFEREARLLDVKAPCYVFGDIHGNFDDLQYFMGNLIPFKHIKYSSHNYLFLGDYVDRGRHDVECLAYLLALKVQSPNKIFILRGNHEDRRQNAKLEESFHRHCVELFGKDNGEEVWRRANEVFNLMPLCAVIDNRIFCCHGGIPRVPRLPNGKLTPIREVMKHVPCPLDTIGDSDNVYQQVATDLLWGDPATDRDTGVRTFERNESRGCSCVFGKDALEEFLASNGFNYFIRAHQWFSFGVNISKSGKLITLFTSSNYCDANSCAGCALVTTDDKIQLLMKEHHPAQSEKKAK
eukprot:Sspe_Gene.66654::Locus_39372_Transcript_1_1_Confidence_1.000_Length_1692::g.66654::m.66654